jgi:hypothetical protein
MQEQGRCWGLTIHVTEDSRSVVYHRRVVIPLQSNLMSEGSHVSGTVDLTWLIARERFSSFTYDASLKSDTQHGGFLGPPSFWTEGAINCYLCARDCCCLSSHNLRTSLLGEPYALWLVRFALENKYLLSLNNMTKSDIAQMCFLGGTVVYSGRGLPMFRCNILPISSGLKRKSSKQEQELVASASFPLLAWHNPSNLKTEAVRQDETSTTYSVTCN